MSSIGLVKKARRSVELLQSALVAVHAGLDMVQTIIETMVEVRRGLRGIVKLGLILTVVGVGVVIVLRIRRPRDPKPPSTEHRSG